MGSQRAAQASLTDVGAIPSKVEPLRSPPASPVLGFLGDIGRQGWGLATGHGILFTALGVLFLISAIALWIADAGREKVGGGQRAAGSGQTDGESGITDRKSQISPRQAVTVAQLLRTAGCRWADQGSEHGDRLSIGQSLHLASGVAEIQFDVGVKVVLQAPASFCIESAKSARLDRGKLAASLTTAAAHGFCIDTPEAVYVDQGTEFGVEVSPGGSSRACVFKGRVDVASRGEESMTKQLTADQGVRVEDDGQEMTFFEDRGESFIQSVDTADRDRHVIAYSALRGPPRGNRPAAHRSQQEPGAGHERLVVQRQRPVCLVA